MNPSKEPKNQVELLAELADVLTENGLQHLTLEQNGVRMELHAPATEQVVVSTPSVASTSLPEEGSAAMEDEDLEVIASPMVGVFYRASSPSDPPFVEVGDKIEVGQTVGLVEAMKVFNEINSEVEGIVESIEAESSDLVESGSPLIKVRPTAK